MGDITNQYPSAIVSRKGGDLRGHLLHAVSDALKLAVPLVYDISSLWTDPQLSVGIRN